MPEEGIFDARIRRRDDFISQRSNTLPL